MGLGVAIGVAVGVSVGVGVTVAVGVGGFAAAGAWRDRIAWWALLVAVVLTWVSGLDYARIAPRTLRREGTA